MQTPEHCLAIAEACEIRFREISRGNPIEDCSTPMGKLPMNDRARAWLKYYDELQSPALNECAAITVPNLLGVDYNAHLLDSIVRYVAPELGWR